MPAALVLEVHALDVLHTQWCASCALPSGHLVKMAVVDSRSLRIVGRSTVFVCGECDTRVTLPGKDS